jgi:hypothetical protein
MNGPWKGEDVRKVIITFMPDSPQKELTLVINSVAGCKAVADGLNAAGYPLPEGGA